MGMWTNYIREAVWMKWFSKKEKQAEKAYKVIEITVTDMRDAIRKWEDDQSKGVYRTILVKDDHSIDVSLLKPYLGGIPSGEFYMSKKTYEIFNEPEKDLAVYLDIVQEAVDKYIQTEKKLPVIDFDRTYRLNYFLLESKGYLKEKPPFTFYLVPEEENLISHKPPKK
jgi:hypothetical protein